MKLWGRAKGKNAIGQMWGRCPITKSACDGPGCELWYESTDCCSIVVIADSLRHLAALADKKGVG